MKQVSFKPSAPASLGVELEFQIIDPQTFNLTSRSKDLIRLIQESSYQKQIKPEVTQGMIEINSSIHTSPKNLYEEFKQIELFLLTKGTELGIQFCGGGTHPFEKWKFSKIFPMRRYKKLAKQYRYLTKYTVFGQHIHVGCANGEDAIFLTHALARYVSQLIALSASSPYHQSADTGFQSSRSNIFSSFPSTGVMPYFQTWAEFSRYFYQMRKLGIIESMKDIYWDIRPKPEFGTVEIRVCDCPLTIRKAILIAAYVQSLAHYLLEQRPQVLNQDLYYLYPFNRFQAARYGFDGNFINPFTLENISIWDDILITMDAIENNARVLNNIELISELRSDVLEKKSDAELLRNLFKQEKSYPKMVKKQCELWMRDCQNE